MKGNQTEEPIQELQELNNLPCNLLVDAGVVLAAPPDDLEALDLPASGDNSELLTELEEEAGAEVGTFFEMGGQIDATEGELSALLSSDSNNQDAAFHDLSNDSCFSYFSYPYDTFSSQLVTVPVQQANSIADDFSDGNAYAGYSGNIASDYSSCAYASVSSADPLSNTPWDPYAGYSGNMASGYSSCAYASVSSADPLSNTSWDPYAGYSGNLASGYSSCAYGSASSTDPLSNRAPDPWSVAPCVDVFGPHHSNFGIQSSSLSASHETTQDNPSFSKGKSRLTRVIENKNPYAIEWNPQEELPHNTCYLMLTYSSEQLRAAISKSEESLAKAKDKLRNSGGRKRKGVAYVVIFRQKQQVQLAKNLLDLCEEVEQLRNGLIKFLMEDASSWNVQLSFTPPSGPRYSVTWESPPKNTSKGASRAVGKVRRTETAELYRKAKAEEVESSRKCLLEIFNNIKFLYQVLSEKFCPAAQQEQIIANVFLASASGRDEFKDAYDKALATLASFPYKLYGDQKTADPFQERFQRYQVFCETCLLDYYADEEQNIEEQNIEKTLATCEQVQEPNLRQFCFWKRDVSEPKNKRVYLISSIKFSSYLYAFEWRPAEEFEDWLPESLTDDVAEQQLRKLAKQEPRVAKLVKSRSRNTPYAKAEARASASLFKLVQLYKAHNHLYSFLIAFFTSKCLDSCIPSVPEEHYSVKYKFTEQRRKTASKKRCEARKKAANKFKSKGLDSCAPSASKEHHSVKYKCAERRRKRAINERCNARKRAANEFTEKKLAFIKILIERWLEFRRITGILYQTLQNKFCENPEQILREGLERMCLAPESAFEEIKNEVISFINSLPDRLGDQSIATYYYCQYCEEFIMLDVENELKYYNADERTRDRYVLEELERHKATVAQPLSASLEPNFLSSGGKRRKRSSYGFFQTQMPPAEIQRVANTEAVAGGICSMPSCSLRACF